MFNFSTKQSSTSTESEKLRRREKLTNNFYNEPETANDDDVFIHF